MWAANLAALELHAPMARADDIETPTMVVFDLDPGAPATIIECARGRRCSSATCSTASSLEVLRQDVGSKGLQLYVPLNTPAHARAAPATSRSRSARLLEKHHPKRVTTIMRKDLRGGQGLHRLEPEQPPQDDDRAYSLRARPHPTVSTPVTWDEVEAAANGKAPLVFEAADVLDRVDELGDLFAPVLELKQKLPTPS